jgi:hypothetical protein
MQNSIVKRKVRSATGKAKVSTRKAFQSELKNIEEKAEVMCQWAAEMLGPNAEVTHCMHQMFDCLQMLEWAWVRSQTAQNSPRVAS